MAGAAWAFILPPGYPGARASRADRPGAGRSTDEFGTGGGLNPTVFDWIMLVSAAGLLAVWGFYPVVMGLLSMLVRRRRVPGVTAAPRVSVVIATRDARADVDARVRNIREAHPSDIEVVVAVDRDAGLAAYAGLRGCEVVESEGPGKAAALNAGVRAATGEVIVFADTHQRFEPETIPALVAALADPRVGGVTGKLEIPRGGLVSRLYWRYERWLRRCEAGVHSSVGATGAVYAIRRSLWEPLRPDLLLDDLYTPMQIVLRGYRIAFAERAIAVETRKTTPSIEYGRKVRTLTGVMQLCAWLPAVLVPVRNPIWLQFVFHKLLRMLTPYGVSLIAIGLAYEAGQALGGYALAVAAAAVILLLWLWRAKRGWRVRLREILSEGFLLQAATVMAGINGLRGRWQVWHG